MSAALLNLKSRLERSKANDDCNDKSKGNDTGTQEVIDPKAWVERIHSQGNKPDDWLQYTRYIRLNMKFTDRVKQHNFLSQMYDKAIKEIPIDPNKKNESFAKLFIEYSVIKRQYIPDDAEHLLSSARQMFRRLAIVHIASAEFEAQKGNVNKAKKILEKARQFEASPDQLLLEALKKLQDGEVELMSHSFLCDLNSTTENDYRSSTSSQESTGEMKNALNVTNNLTDTTNLTGQNLTNRVFPRNVPSHTPSTESAMENTTTSGVRAEISGQLTKTNEITTNSIQGFSRVNRSDSNLPTVHLLHDLRKSEDITDSGPSEMDTAPIQLSVREGFESLKSRLSNSCRATLRSYHSTPECRSVYKSSVSKYRRPVGIGMPQRVRKLDLPFKVAVDEESDEDDTMSSFTPIDGTTSHGAHTSGYVSQSDATVPLETTKSPVKHNLEVIHTSGTSRSPLRPLQIHNSKLDNLQQSLSSWNEKHKETHKTDSQQVLTNSVFVGEKLQFPSHGKLLSEKGPECVDLKNQQHMLSHIKSQPDLSVNNHLQKCNGNQHDVLLGNIHQGPKNHRHESKETDEEKVKQKQEDLLRLHQHHPEHQILQNQQHQTNSSAIEIPPSNTSKPGIQSSAVTESQSELPIAQTPSEAPGMSVPIVLSQPKPDAQTLRKSPAGQVASATTPAAPTAAKASCESAVPQMKVIFVNGNPYHVLSCVGKGGSSKVYKVLDSTGHHGVIHALKVVSLDATNEQIVEGYKNEINLLKRLQYCPKVIHLYDFEHRKEENLLYILMECGELDFAKYLKNTIDQEGKLSPLYIKFHWNSMLQAVGALHKEGIIHSDLKPSNFLLIDGQLKLIDFGIAKAIQQDKTSIITDTQVGTLNYMSPETIRDYCGLSDEEEEEERRPVYKIGVKSDVWSLGCILYCMVYGHTPFQKIVKQFAKLQAIINPNYKISFPEIQDKNLMDVMKHCLERDPKMRPSISDLQSHDYLLSV